MKISAALVIIFWHYTVFQYRFDSPQVKRNLISSITKVDINLFLPCPILLDFSILFQIFCPGLQKDKFNFSFNLPIKTISKNKSKNKKADDNKKFKETVIFFADKINLKETINLIDNEVILSNDVGNMYLFNSSIETLYKKVIQVITCYKFKHKILDSLNPICDCRTDIETTSH